MSRNRSRESHTNILARITCNAEKNAAVTRPDIRNYCREVCKIEATRAWVDSFISRHSAELIENKSLPQEEPHLQVRRVFVAQTVRSMHEAVQGRPAGLVFNSILMKSEYLTGRTDNRRRWWFREPPRTSCLPFTSIRSDCFVDTQSMIHPLKKRAFQSVKAFGARGSDLLLRLHRNLEDLVEDLLDPILLHRGALEVSLGLDLLGPSLYVG
jgi:hypothetical protein